ncbi:hypothetical protein M426DRAFT_26577 [Hypoxylon sp. CI-4A]|nr:hypothetical protein M426DRAFT_26577 [Hypoxylon sp. CI-4A]
MGQAISKPKLEHKTRVYGFNPQPRPGYQQRKEAARPKSGICYLPIRPANYGNPRTRHARRPERPTSSCIHDHQDSHSAGNTHRNGMERARSTSPESFMQR